MKQVLKKFIGNKKSEKKIDYLPDPKFEFDNTMDFVKYVLEYEPKDKQTIILDYIMEIIKKDLQYDLLTTILYDKDFTKEIRFIFPYNYDDEYKASNLFNHLHTDGVHWYNSHNNDKYSIDLVDFRIGILYEVAKIKYKLQNNSLS